MLFGISALTTCVTASNGQVMRAVIIYYGARPIFFLGLLSGISVDLLSYDSQINSNTTELQEKVQDGWL